MAYGCFARYYDALTENVQYADRAAYFDGLIRRYREQDGNLLLDLACGTGSLTAALLALGYDVIGVDGSAEMLSVAQSKLPNTLFLCQQMQELDLYGTIDVTICALDSLNHITDLAVLQRVFRRVATFTAPGGLFIFDVNTAYKQREVLGNQTFFFEIPDCCCVWQNTYEAEQRSTQIDLDFFERVGDFYARESESFVERVYTQEELAGCVQAAGLEVLAILGDDGLLPPTDTTQRLVYVTRKLPIQQGGMRANNRKTIKMRRK